MRNQFNCNQNINTEFEKDLGNTADESKTNQSKNRVSKRMD